MSTKIYYGARIPHGIAKAYKLLMAAKPEAGAIAQDEQNKTIASLVVLAERGEGEVPTPFKVWMELEASRHKCRREGLRYGADYDFEVSLFPRTRDTLAISYTEEPRLRTWFFALPFVQEYGYWNNSDKPDSIPQREWGTRKRSWDRAFPFRPNETDLTMTIVKTDVLDFPRPGPEWEKLKVWAVEDLAERDRLRAEARRSVEAEARHE